MISKIDIETLYFKKKLSLAKIAKRLGVSTPTVANCMNKYGIERRSISQALTGRKLSKEHALKVRKNIDKANTERSKNGVIPQERERLREIAKLRKGYKHSEDTKHKMSVAHLGKKMSDETKQKMSEARKGKIVREKHPLYGMERPDMKGENNPNWNGGISSLYRRIRKMTKYTEWRMACFERDDFVCQKCGKRGSGDLNVDHIKPLALIVEEYNLKTTYQAQGCRELWETANGRTLCEPCHRNTDTWGEGTKILLRAVSTRKD